MANGLNKWVVYIHTTPNNKSYVGITCQNPTRRWRSNGVGYKANRFFYNAILKYGWENIHHVILYWNLSRDEANKIEMELINELHSNDKRFGYNLTAGGDGVKGYSCPEWKKKKQKITMAGSNNPMYGISLKGKSGKENPMYGKPSPIRKKVMCVTTGEIFDCVTHGANKYNTYQSDISKVCKGTRRYAGKFNGEELIWRYV